MSYFEKNMWNKYYAVNSNWLNNTLLSIIRYWSLGGENFRLHMGE